MDIKRPANIAIQSSWKHNNEHTQVNFANMAQFDKQFQKLSINLPPPNKETLSRHSILGPNGLQGQCHGPSTGVKVHYPSNMDLMPAENSSLNQAGQFDTLALKDGDLGGISSTMESVLSLDDGRWSRLAEESCPRLINEAKEDPFWFVSIKQPLPPPVLTEVQQDYAPISPSKVADPRPGPAKHSQDGPPTSNYDGGFLVIGSGKYRKEFGNMWCSCWFIEKQGFPHHYTYNPKAGINFGFVFNNK